MTEKKEGVFKRLFGSICVRTAQMKLEADLYRPEGKRYRSGEFEYKLFTDGSSEFEFELPRTHGLPRGTVVRIVAAGKTLRDYEIPGRNVDITFDSATVDIPSLQIGDSVQVFEGDIILLEGTLEKDR